MPATVIHTFDHLMKKLETRTLKNLTTLHFFTKNGIFFCLDLHMAAFDLEELINRVTEVLMEIKPDEILPAASREMWSEIWGKPLAWRRVFPKVYNKVTELPIAIAMVNL